MAVRVQEFTEKRKTWKEQHDISLATYLSKCKLKETAGMEVIFADSTRLSVKHIFDSQERMIDIVQVYSVSEKMLEGFMIINPKSPKQTEQVPYHVTEAYDLVERFAKIPALSGKGNPDRAIWPLMIWKKKQHKAGNQT